MSAPAQAALAVETDAELVAAVLAGERERFSELVRRHQEPLYRYGRGMSLSTDAAQDLVQECFIRAFTRLEQCDNPARFASWLFRIFRNLALDYHRDVRRREVPADVLEQSPAPGSTAFETRALLNDALNALPELLREAFLLRHQHGYAYEEIAEITGSGTSAVKMRVHRAREQLREALTQDAT